MSERQDQNKWNADAQYAGGATQERAGKITGDNNLRAQGIAKKRQGEHDYNAADSNQTNDQSKTSGRIHATKGAVKESLGSTLKNPSLEQSGAHERRTGNQALENAKTRETVGGNAERAKGNVKEKTGRAVGNPQMEYEGTAEKAQGRTRRDLNQ